MANKFRGKVIWFTGLSGAGKSTLSNALEKYLTKLKFKILCIDGDKFRKKTKNKNNFTRENIFKNNYLIINYILKKQDNYDYLLVSVISPLKKTRNRAKKVFSAKYFEVFVKCNIKELKRRDTKGLYRLADEKKIKDLIGYKSKIKYEISNYEIITVDTFKMNLKNSITKIVKKIL